MGEAGLVAVDLVGGLAGQHLEDVRLEGLGIRARPAGRDDRPEGDRVLADGGRAVELVAARVARHLTVGELEEGRLADRNARDGVDRHDGLDVPTPAFERDIRYDDVAVDEGDRRVRRR